MKLEGRIQVSNHPERGSFMMPDGEVLGVFMSDVEFDPDALTEEAAWGIEPEIPVPAGTGQLICLVVASAPESMTVQIPTAVESDGLITRLVTRSVARDLLVE